MPAARSWPARRSTTIRRCWAYLRTADPRAAQAVQRADGDQALPGVVGWGALASGTAPDARPWAHLDLSESE